MKTGEKVKKGNAIYVGKDGLAYNVLSEHTKLREICDLIGYEGSTKIEIEYIKGNIFGNVREIIFTPSFMDKFVDNCKSTKGDRILKDFSIGVMENLDNPVGYLFNLLELGT